MGKVNLPKGWAITKLELLTTDISYGYTAPSSSDEVGPKMLRITDIQDNSVIWSDVPYCEIEEEKLEKYLLKKNDLVFARTGATVGKSFLIRTEPPKAVYASYLIRVRTVSEELISLLSHFFNSQQYWQQITEFSSGIGQPNVNGTKLKQLTIPLPPLAEQKVITDKLDIMLSQVEATKSRIERISKILKILRQSVLAAAANGNLTKGWRNRGSDKNFIKLGDAGVEIKTGPFGSALHKSDYQKNGIPVINPMHISEGNIYPSRTMTISEEKYEQLEAWHLRVGDVVLGRRGEMGRAATIKKPTRMLCGTGSMILRASNNILPEYLEIILRSPTTISYLNVKSVGSTMVNLNQNVLKELILYFPSIDEQSKIISHVKEFFTFSDNIEQKASAALERVNNLTQSILAKAFIGELTNDWREANPELISGENSAETLLKKIKIEREALRDKTGVRVVRRIKENSTMMANKLISVLEDASDWITAQEAFRLCGVTDGTSTERIEELYSELRILDKAGRLQIDTVTDEQGRKLYDRLKLAGA